MGNTPIKDSIDSNSAKAVDQAEKDFERRKQQQEMLGKGLGAEWLAPAALGGATDAATTYMAMKRGAKEGNPLYKIAGGNPEATTALAALMTAAQVYAANRMAKKGNRTGGKIAAGLKAGISALVASKNVSNYKRLGKK